MSAESDARHHALGNGQCGRCQPAHGADDRVRSNHRVVIPGDDVAVVEQDEVDETAEAVDCFLVVAADRLVAEVSAGHHQRAAYLLEQEVVKRGRRQHDTDLVQPGRNSRRQRGSAEQREEDYRPGGVGQSDASLGIDLCNGARRCEIGDHDRQGFGRPPFALVKQGDDRFISGIAGQLKTAETLDGDNCAVAKRSSGHVDRVSPDDGAVRVGQPQTRSALWTCHGLGVEPAIAGVLVLPSTVVAHREAVHRRALTVVREGRDDGETRSTICAVGKGVAVTSVGQVRELGVTSGAHHGVGRRGLDGFALSSAPLDPEARDATDSISSIVTALTRASCGASATSSLAKTSRAAGSPSASITTASGVFLTQPARP